MPLSGPAGQSVMETGLPLWTPMPERLARLASVFCHRPPDELATNYCPHL